MATPLEAIPEETQTPTSARVTSEAPKTKPATEKNRGRVASGKRLAEHYRLAREAKKKAEAEKTAPSTSAVIMLVSVDLDGVKELQKELKKDHIIYQELTNLAEGLALRCRRWPALANAALITTKHVKF